MLGARLAHLVCTHAACWTHPVVVCTCCNAHAGSDKDEAAAGPADAGGVAKPASRADPSSTSARIVYDDAAIDRLVDRSELEARHRRGEVEELEGEGEETGSGDFFKAFRVRRGTWERCIITKGRGEKAVSSSWSV